MKKSVFLYGASGLGAQYLPIISIAYNVQGFIDSDLNKAQTRFAGLPVKHASEISKLNTDLIIITSSYHKEISQLIQANCQIPSIFVGHCADILALKHEIKALQTPFRQVQMSKLPLVPLPKECIAETQLICNRKELLNLLPKQGVVAELGVAQGNFSEHILSINQPSTLHLVDIWDSERYGQPMFDGVKKRFQAHLNKQVFIHRDLSTSAVEDFADHSLDWVYIDTNHSYQTTKQELHLYRQKIKHNGYLCGHDYTMGNWAADYRYGVMEAVHEFCVQEQFRLVWLTMDLSEGQSFAIQAM